MNHRFLSIISIRKKLNFVSVPVIALLAISSLFITFALAETGAPATYSLAASSNGQGSISPSGALTVLEGARASFIFNPDINCHIADVIVDGDSVGPIYALSFENINASHTVQAVFEVDSGAVNASADVKDTIASKGQTIAELR